MKGRRILGIDPGSGRLGHGLIEIIDGHAHLIGHGCIETTINSPEPQKLATIYEEMVALVETIKPDLIAVEMLFFARNVTTAFSVGQARGVVLLVAAQANVPIAEIAPLKLKKVLLGNGASKKKDIQNFVKEYFGLEKIPKPDDAADAIAIALSQVIIS
ncbi:crossover junction endodeoxyribonuclease RuvC [Candidatus Berkelbacteria bacterium]|nr:crossover junction endodeoxyribonuclease RuvC [Candidatus Berkelbacteria bacterium]